MLAAMASEAIWVQMSTIGTPGIETVAAVVDAERPDVRLLRCTGVWKQGTGRAGWS